MNKVETITRPDAAIPVTSPWESMATEPAAAAAALELVAANAALVALSLIPEGVVPSVKVLALVEILRSLGKLTRKGGTTL